MNIKAVSVYIRWIIYTVCKIKSKSSSFCVAPKTSSHLYTRHPIVSSYFLWLTSLKNDLATFIMFLYFIVFIPFSYTLHGMISSEIIKSLLHLYVNVWVGTTCTSKLYQPLCCHFLKDKIIPLAHQLLFFIKKIIKL